jgi:RNA polymerase sigma-70 factor, ECF subfamily
MSLRARKSAYSISLDDVEAGKSMGQEQVQSGEPNPEYILEKSQLLSAMRFEIRRLPSLLRETLVMRDVQNLPTEEVARQLGISVSALKSRLIRARNELRLRMQRYLPNANLD